MQHHQGDGDLGDVASVEDRAESLPPEAESIVDDVRREKLVTQLAVHSASDDLPTRAWQAGDATQPIVCTPYDPKVAQQPTTLGRHVAIRPNEMQKHESQRMLMDERNIQIQIRSLLLKNRHKKTV